MPTIKVTDAASEPITLAQAKLWTRVDVPDDDELFTGLCIPAARQDAEARMGRTLITTTWKLVLNAFTRCGSCIPLQYPNLQSVDSILYYDTSGVQQTLDPVAYLLDTVSQPGGVAPAPGLSWPATQARINAVEIQYKAGWTDAAQVPAVIKQWIALRAATLYAHREVIIAGASVAEIPFVNSLLDSYKVWQL